MEADWEIEIGPQAPVIDALWTGFVDLRDNPARVHEIQEASRNPALAKALIRLNHRSDHSMCASTSGLWTSKCDLWESDPCDPGEMNATAETSAVNPACYIDLLPRENLVFETISEAEQLVRETVARLQLRHVCCCRVDLVIRRAFAEEKQGFGLTAYISACGADEATATQALATALTTFVDAISP